MKAILLSEKKKKLDAVYPESIRHRLRDVAALAEGTFTRADILTEPARFADTEFIFSTWGMPTFDEEEIKTLFPSLKCVFYAAGSVQNFARPFLHCGIMVFSAWAANAVPVAEMTVAQIILANKGYFWTNRLYHAKGNRVAKDAFSRCHGNYGETVGIIGAGMIGKLVIRMLGAYRLNVIVFDPFLSDEDAKELGVQKCELSELFARAFVISNHLANNEQTKKMLDYRHFSLMREGAVLINTGRGAQLVEEDLVRILRERPDLTALLDVTYPEPPVEGHPFYTLDNCLLTPHIAGSAGDEVVRMAEYMIEEFERYRSDKPCKYEVSEKMLETMA